MNFPLEISEHIGGVVERGVQGGLLFSVKYTFIITLSKIYDKNVRLCYNMIVNVTLKKITSNTRKKMNVTKKKNTNISEKSR